MFRTSMALAVAIAAITTPATAQMVDVPIWSNGILGQQALRNTYDNYNRKNGIDSERDGDKARSASKCSADALPAADRKRMEAEYMRRLRADGKASADAWVREQGRRFHMKLVADGVCPPTKEGKQVAEAKPRADKKPVLDKDGRPCTRTRVENRVSPGFGGEAMTMGLVVVCAN